MLHVRRQSQRRFLISAAIPLFAQLSGNSVSFLTLFWAVLMTDGQWLHIMWVETVLSLGCC